MSVSWCFAIDSQPESELAYGIDLAVARRFRASL